MNTTQTSKLKISDEYGQYRDFAASLPETFTKTGRTLYAGRNIVKEMDAGVQTLIVKKYHRPNIAQRVAYSFFKRSKAERAFDFAIRMRGLGIDTPHEVACVETRQHGMLDDSYFVSLPCMLPSLSSLLRRTDFDKRVADELAAFVVRLHELGVMHGDLNLTNILYEQDGTGRTHFTLIDTNRSKFGKNLTRRQCVDNIMRLSHDRPLLDYIVRRYASIRKWDEGETSEKVMHTLERFEHRRAFKRKIKGLFKAL